MCGLLGIISKKDTSKEIVKLQNLILHRGPDSHGIFEKNINNFHASFAHSRLSILDPSSRGSQPMIYKSFVLLFNGEIYNFGKLKKILQNNGYKFESNSDTEVVLKSFDFWGKDCVKYFDGMFAFSIIDYKTNNIYLFRDKFGVKPLYFFFNQQNLIFSSEAKPIIESSFFKKNLNYSAIKDYFKLGYLKNNNRIFKDLHLLENSSFIKFSLCGDIKIEEKQKFFNNSDTPILQHEREENAVENLNELIIKSCEKRLISDAPVGYFLSGGIDSSLIAAIIKKELNKNIPAFTLADKEAGTLDFEISKKISNFLKIEHFFFDISENKKKFYETFENLSSFIDEPFADISTISTIILSAEVKKRVKVVISGDGADEIFGGYPKYTLMLSRQDIVRKFKPAQKIILEILNKIISLNPHFNNLKLKKIISHLSSLNEKSLLEVYNSFYLSETYFKKNFFSENTEILKKIENNNLSFEKILLEDQKGYLIDNILFKLDRSTMSCGLEGREPFLDKDLKEFSDKHSKFIFFRDKQMLKKIHYKYFGKNFYNYNTPKQGFVAKYSSLINDDTKKFTDTLFDKNFLKKQDIFEYENLNSLYKKNKKTDRDLKLIYLISCFQIWYKKWM